MFGGGNSLTEDLVHPHPTQKHTYVHKRTQTQVRKWKNDMFRTTLGLVEAAAAEPAGTQCAKSNRLLLSLHQHSETDYTDIAGFTPCTLNLIHKSSSFHSLFPSSLSHFPHTSTQTQLPKHLRPEAEIWKPSGHKQVKLPSVLEQVPNVQISGSWEHSSISDKQRNSINHLIRFTHLIHQTLVTICNIRIPPCCA